MDHQFRRRLVAGETLLGTIVSLRSPEVAELLAETGFDWLFIDGEHGAFDIANIQTVLQAADSLKTCIVRIPALDEAAIKKVLDIGATGVIVPQIHTAEQAEAVVRWGRYPPQGGRGLGVARVQRYGFALQRYADSANEEVVLIVQAESADSVENIDAIAAVPGIDAVLIGPYDLSASLGHAGQVDHPVVTEAIAHIIQVCKAYDRPLGIFGMTADSVRPYRDQGVTLIAVGMDSVLLGTAARELHDELM